MEALVRSDQVAREAELNNEITVCRRFIFVPRTQVGLTFKHVWHKTRSFGRLAATPTALKLII
jgi:hypothetical protein